MEAVSGTRRGGGGGGNCYYHFNNKLQGICAKASDEDISINVGVGGVKSSADHLYLTTAQLGGIGLQEFAHICLYNVIKAFLGPTASAWLTSLAWEQSAQ